jgi:hypothetical protein
VRSALKKRKEKTISKWDTRRFKKCTTIQELGQDLRMYIKPLINQCNKKAKSTTILQIQQIMKLTSLI